MYKRRLRGYAAVGYKVRPRQYDGDTFETAFLADISNAKHSIVIACSMIRIYRHPIVIQKLIEQQSNGVSIYVNIRKEGYDEVRFKEVGGTYSVNDAQTIQCAIIDKSICWYGDINFLGYHSSEDTVMSICWYGDINFLGYHSSEDTVMRINDAKMAGELLDITYTSHTNRQNEKV